MGLYNGRQVGREECLMRTRYVSECDECSASWQMCFGGACLVMAFLSSELFPSAIPPEDMWPGSHMCLMTSLSCLQVMA